MNKRGTSRQRWRNWSEMRSRMRWHLHAAIKVKQRGCSAARGTICTRDFDATDGVRKQGFAVWVCASIPERRRGAADKASCTEFAAPTLILRSPAGLRGGRGATRRTGRTFRKLEDARTVSS